MLKVPRKRMPVTPLRILMKIRDVMNRARYQRALEIATQEGGKSIIRDRFRRRGGKGRASYKGGPQRGFKWLPSKRAYLLGQPDLTMQDTGELFTSITSGLTVRADGNVMRFIPGPQYNKRKYGIHETGGYIRPKGISDITGKPLRKLAIPLMDSKGNKLTRMYPKAYRRRFGPGSIIASWDKKRFKSMPGWIGGTGRRGSILFTRIKGEWTPTWVLVRYVRMPMRSILYPIGMFSRKEYVQHEVQYVANRASRIAISAIRTAYRELGLKDPFPGLGRTSPTGTNVQPSLTSESPTMASDQLALPTGPMPLGLPGV